MKYEPPPKRQGEYEIPRHLVIDLHDQDATCLACGERWSAHDLPNLMGHRTPYEVQKYLLDSIERHHCDTTAFYAPPDYDDDPGPAPGCRVDSTDATRCDK